MPEMTSELKNTLEARRRIAKEVEAEVCAAEEARMFMLGLYEALAAGSEVRIAGSRQNYVLRVNDSIARYARSAAAETVYNILTEHLTAAVRSAASGIDAALFRAYGEAGDSDYTGDDRNLRRVRIRQDDSAPTECSAGEVDPD